MSGGNKTVRFSAQVLTPEDGVGAYIEFPFNVLEVFKKSGRILVRCRFDGLEYRGSLLKMGTARHIIGIRKDLLKQIGKQPGDIIEVIMAEDLEDRTITLSEDIQSFFEINNCLELFKALPFSRKRRMIEGIERARKAETRVRRLERAVLDLTNTAGSLDNQLS